MSSIAPASRSISVGIARPAGSGRRSPPPNRSAAPMSWLSGPVDRAHGPERGHRRPAAARPGTGPRGRLRRLVRLPAQIAARAPASGWSAPGRARARRPAGYRTGARARSAMRRASSGPAQVGQGVRHAVGHLDLRLVGRDLVDDVAVGGGERAEPAIAALVGVGGVALLDRRASGAARCGRTRYCSADRISDETDETRPLPRSVLSSSSDSSWLTDASSERIEVTPSRAMPKTSADQEHHAGDDPAAQAAQRLHACPPRPRRRSPPRPRPGAPGRCRRSGWGRRRGVERHGAGDPLERPASASPRRPAPGGRPRRGPGRAMTSRSR